MAHFAKLDSNSIVTGVVVVNNSVIENTDGTESELKGEQFLNSLLGVATWKQTSYNGTFRKNFAGVGYKYDSTRDAFIPPKPFNSWTLNETTCLYEPPVAYPDNKYGCEWDEDNEEWINCLTFPSS